MPFIQVSTNVKISQEARARLVRDFGKAISLWPGKSEPVLMLRLDGECAMAFGGQTDAPIACVEVHVLGELYRDAAELLTRALTDSLEAQLAIEPDQVYVRYDATPLWGRGGVNY